VVSNFYFLVLFLPVFFVYFGFWYLLSSFILTANLTSRFVF